MKHVQVTEVPEHCQFIDVREADEYAAGHARGTLNLPMSGITGQLDQIDQSQEVYLICKLGGRSHQVGEYLEQRGFEVTNVEGGTEAWKAAGLPMEG